MATCQIDRIVFTGDCLRSQLGEPNQWANVLWLQQLLEKKLRDLTGLPSAALLPAPADCWKALGKPPSILNWSLCFWDRACDDLCEHLRTHFDGALVVAIELSPLLQHALDRMMVPWIDVGVSPLRFMPDFPLTFRFSDSLNRPQGFDLSAAELDDGIQHVRNFYPATFLPGTVFFAQTSGDRTLIGRQGFFDVGQVTPMLEDLPRPLWVQPHPLEPLNPLIRTLLDAGARLLPISTYAALVSEMTVASIASSVVVEAAHFGRPTRVLHPDVLNRNATGLTTLNGYRHSSFWSQALSMFGLTDSDFAEPFESDRLRSALGYYGLSPDVYRHE